MEKFLKYIINIFFIINIVYLTGCSEDTVQTPQSAHFQASGLIIYNETLSDTILYYHNGVLKPGFDSLFVPFNALSGHWTIKFLDANKIQLEPPSGPNHTLGWLIDDPNMLELYRHGNDIWEFHLKGKALGTTKIKFQILHEGHADFQTIPIPVKIDSSVIGEVAGAKLFLEKNDSLLVKDSAGVVSGNLRVAVNDSLGHIEIKFLDITGNTFVYSPPSPPYSLGWIIADATKISFEPPTSIEPWAFKIIGKQVGTTTIKFRFLLNNSPEWESRDINVNVY